MQRYLTVDCHQADPGIQFALDDDDTDDADGGAKSRVRGTHAAGGAIGSPSPLSVGNARSCSARTTASKRSHMGGGDDGDDDGDDDDDEDEKDEKAVGEDAAANASEAAAPSVCCPALAADNDSR
jgi:hypothetical protein